MVIIYKETPPKKLNYFIYLFVDVPDTQQKAL